MARQTGPSSHCCYHRDFPNYDLENQIKFIGNVTKHAVIMHNYCIVSIQIQFVKKLSVITLTFLISFFTVNESIHVVVVTAAAASVAVVVVVVGVGVVVARPCERKRRRT